MWRSLPLHRKPSFARHPRPRAGTASANNRAFAYLGTAPRRPRSYHRHHQEWLVLVGARPCRSATASPARGTGWFSLSVVLQAFPVDDWYAIFRNSRVGLVASGAERGGVFGCRQQVEATVTIDDPTLNCVVKVERLWAALRSRVDFQRISKRVLAQHWRVLSD